MPEKSLYRLSKIALFTSIANEITAALITLSAIFAAIYKLTHFNNAITTSISITDMLNNKLIIIYMTSFITVISSCILPLLLNLLDIYCMYQTIQKYKTACDTAYFIYGFDLKHAISVMTLTVIIFTALLVLLIPFSLCTKLVDNTIMLIFALNQIISLILCRLSSKKLVQTADKPPSV